MASANKSANNPLMEPKHGTNYSYAPEVEEYTIPFAEYAQTSPSFRAHATATATAGTTVQLAGATGSVVYCNDKVLLVQRAPTDSMPLQWETPGGACDDIDASILDSAARELFEETGLHALRFEKLLMRHDWLHRRVGIITKFVFQVEVARVNNSDGDSAAVVVDGMPAVTLDPKEHCAFIWASKNEVEQGRAGEIELRFTNEKLVRQYVLAGFEQ